jgi:hypothetical protein
VGVFTVLAVWWTAREIFAADEETMPLPETPAVASNLAVLSAAVLATLFLHVHLSRDGYRLLTQALVGSLAMAALWRGLRGKGSLWFGVGGALLGLAIYTYTSARFFVVLMVVFFPLEWFLSRSNSLGLTRRHFKWLLVAGAVALTVIAPMAIFLWNHPGFVAERSDQVSVLNSALSGGRPLLALLDSTWRNLAGLVWQGTEDAHWNIPGRPMLDVLTIPLFLVGVIVALRRARRPAYLFLLLWFVVLQMPAFLSYDRVPVFHRSLGALPAIAMLVALGGWEIWSWLVRRLRRLPTSSVLIPTLIVLTCSGGITAYDYLVRWGPSWDAYLATEPYWLELVEQMDQDAKGGMVYLFPYDLRNGAYRHPDLDLFYHGASPYYFVSEHEGEILAELTEATRGQQEVRVIDWKVGRSAEADAKHLISALLTMHGQPLGVTSETAAYRIEGFRLTGTDIDFRVRPPMSPVGIVVGDGLTLQAFSMGATGQVELKTGNVWQAGRYGWVLLVWKADAPMSVNYTASVRLVDQGRMVAQADKLLLNGFHMATSQWHAGEQNYEPFLLLPDAAGTYRLQLVVYDAGTMQELLPGGVWLPATVEVQP